MANFYLFHNSDKSYEGFYGPGRCFSSYRITRHPTPKCRTPRKAEEGRGDVQVSEILNDDLDLKAALINCTLKVNLTLNILI